MSPTLKRRSILCVQPDAAFCESLSTTLHEYDCLFAGTAYEAVRDFHARSFDAYLLEFWLPDWAGAPLCREIRRSDPHSPIVFCTTAAGDREEKRALRAGANAYLRKPVDPAIMTSTLRELFVLCDGRNLRARIETERAVREAMERRAADATARAAQESMAQSLERAARAQAYKVFIASGGTRANFERWWPQLFGMARATFRGAEQANHRLI